MFSTESCYKNTFLSIKQKKNLLYSVLALHNGRRTADRQTDSILLVQHLIQTVRPVSMVLPLGCAGRYKWVIWLMPCVHTKCAAPLISSSVSLNVVRTVQYVVLPHGYSILKKPDNLSGNSFLILCFCQIPTSPKAPCISFDPTAENITRTLNYQRNGQVHGNTGVRPEMLKAGEQLWPESFAVFFAMLVTQTVKSQGHGTDIVWFYPGENHIP